MKYSKSEMMARLSLLLWFLLSFHLDDCSVSWSGFSGSSSLNENDDSDTLLDGFSATCNLFWEDCSWWDPFSFFCEDRSESKACSCSISSNPASGLFYMSGSTSRWYIRKSSCSNTNCGNYPSGSRCSTANGCANAGSHSITIRCQASNSEDSTSATRTHTVTFAGETPSFSITNLDGIPENEESRNTDEIVLTMCTQLKVGVKPEDIDRSHRVGKKDKDGNPRPIIVKFVSYRARQLLYKARVKLRKNGYSDVYVNEDLTHTRNKILYEGRKLFKASKVNGVWSSDGVILIKDEHDEVHRATCLEDLDKFN